MKITKLFVAALAGMAMFSCSNEEEMTNTNPKNTAISVSVANIMNGARAVGELAQGDKVYVDGTATLTIDYTLDGTQKKAEAKMVFKDGECTSIDCNDIPNMTSDKGAKTVHLWNVGIVNKVTVKINDGVKEIAAKTPITKYVSIPAKQIPAYVEQVPTQPTQNQEKFDNNLGNEKAVPDYKNYYMYQVTLQPKNTEFARIELGGIYFQAPDGEKGSKFQTLTLSDVCLDNAVVNKGDIVEPLKLNVSGTINWGAYHDAVAANNFLETSSTNSLPAAKEGVAQSYAYNFWADQMPIIRLHFTNASSSDPAVTVAPDQWAFVKEYQKTDGTKMTAADFKAGTIYRIKKAVISDNNISPDPYGNKQYAIVVTVEPAEWSVTDINAVWNEQ